MDFLLAFGLVCYALAFALHADPARRRRPAVPGAVTRWARAGWRILNSPLRPLA